MNYFKSALQTVGVSALVFAFVACEESPTSGTTGVSPVSNKEGAVFSESFADAGQFTLEKNPEGGYNYSVSARIGSEAEKRVVASIDEATLAGVYQLINGGKSETPAVVTEASKWLESRPSSGAEKLRPTPAPLGKAAAESDFRNGYCREFADGTHYVWRPMNCQWKSNSNYMGAPGVSSYFDGNDRVWVWNATAYTAQLTLWNTAFTAKASTWMPTQTPYTVAWFSWGGTYSNANATVKLPGTIGGELGLSNSSRFYR
jgi:hypothetical protein